MVDRKLVVILGALFGIILFIYLYSSGIAGRVVQWTSLEENAEFAHGLPVLSPEILPNNKTLNVNGTVESTCVEARANYTSFCPSYKQDFPHGCQWWRFFSFSECKKLRTNCLEAFNVSSRVCN